MANLNIMERSKLVLGITLGVLGVLGILANVLADTSSLLKWFVLTLSLGSATFVLVESHIIEYLTHSPEKVLKMNNIITIFAGVISGILIVTSLLVFSYMSGVGLSKVVLDYAKNTNIIGQIFVIALGLIYAFKK